MKIGIYAQLSFVNKPLSLGNYYMAVLKKSWLYNDQCTFWGFAFAGLPGAGAGARVVVSCQFFCYFGQNVTN